MKTEVLVISSGLPVHAQSHQDMLKGAKHQNSSYYSISRLYSSQAVVFSSIRIVWRLCERNSAGRSVRACFGDIKTLMHLRMGYEVFWQNKSHRQIPGIPGRSKARGPRARKTRGQLRQRLSRDHALAPARQKYMSTREHKAISLAKQLQQKCRSNLIW